MNPVWLQISGERVRLTLHVQPGAKKTMVVGNYGDALKIRLAAPPVDGKANAALIQFISERLSVTRSAIHLKSGHACRRKVLEVAGAPVNLVERLQLDSSV